MEINILYLTLTTFALVCLLIPRLATSITTATVGVFCMLIIPETLKGAEKFTLVLILAIFSIWNYISTSSNQLERINSAFATLGAIFGFFADNILGVILSVSLMTVCSLGILFHGFDWKELSNLGVNYVLFSAISLMVMIISLAFTDDLNLTALKSSSKVAQGLLLIGILSKLGTPILNPSGLPLYPALKSGCRLAFWSSVFKFYLGLITLKVVSNLNQNVWLLVAVGLLSMFLGLALMARSDAPKTFVGASGAFSAGVLALMANYVDHSTLIIYLFVYYVSTLATLAAIGTDGKPEYPWISGVGLLVAGGVAPAALILLLKIVLINQVNLPSTTLAATIISLLGSSYFYAKQAAYIFQLSSSPMPRQLASLCLIILIMSTLILIVPGLLIK